MQPITIMRISLILLTMALSGIVMGLVDYEIKRNQIRQFVSKVLEVKE